MSNPFLLIGTFVLALFGVSVMPESNVPQITQTTIALAPYLIEPTTTTSSTLFIDPYASACEQFSALAINIGWPLDERTVLESVMARESGCRPNAHNKTLNRDKSQDWGLLQINGRSWSKWLQKKGIINQTSDLLQAEVNLRAGLEIYNYGVERYGFGWGPWSVK
jgi:hypothetical protein